jgi:membrane protease YdiL (CAAX protease family)
MSKDSSKGFRILHILLGRGALRTHCTKRMAWSRCPFFKQTALQSENPVPINPSFTSREPRSGWWLAPIALLATVVIFYSAQILGLLVVSIFPALHHWPAAQSAGWLTNSVTAQFAYGLLADGLIILGVAGMLKLLHWRWATIGLTRPKWRHIAVGFLAAIPYYVLYIAAVSVVSVFVPGLNIDQKQEIGFNSVHGLWPLALAFISLVVLPPLAEEITMRGFLYTGLRKWLPKVVAALAVSALFGAAHLTEGGAAGPLWIGAIDTFTLSLVLVFLREKTGNLWAGTILHAVKNGVAFLSLFIIGTR